MLTRNLAFGFNILTLVGFVVMGFGLALARRKQIRPPLAYALMGTGTALVVAGLYFTPPIVP
jgi:hypothetical protein